MSKSLASSMHYNKEVQSAKRRLLKSAQKKCLEMTTVVSWPLGNYLNSCVKALECLMY